MSTQEEKSREAFNAWWAGDEGFSCPYDSGAMLVLRDYAFVAWQAARQQLADQIAKELDAKYQQADAKCVYSGGHEAGKMDAFDEAEQIVRAIVPEGV